MLRVHCKQGRRAVAVPGQIRVALVLEDRDTVLSREREQFLTAPARQDRAGRILDRGYRVDVFRNGSLPPEIVENAGERVDPHSLVVQWCADHIDAEALELGERAAIGELLEDDGVAPLKEG